jgi:hypothetical protein
VLAAEKPEIEQPIVITLQGTDVKLSWSANTIDNGSPILTYNI